MAQVTITINDQKLTVPAGVTILEAAEHAGIHIPTLCHIKDIDPRANCRMCVVEVEKFRTFQPACATKVTEGMVIHTDTPAVWKARKLNLELILSHHAVECHHCMRIGSSRCDDLDPYFCEMCFFCDCVKDGFCELQALAREYKVDLLPFEIEDHDHELDISSGVIIRNPNKCVKCKRCVDICNEVQTVHNLCTMNRGTDTKVVPELGKPMGESNCVKCGRCVDVCPTGAIFALEHKDEVIYHAHKYETTSIAQVSEDLLPELSRLFKMNEQAKLGTVVSGLHKIGFDYVVTDKAAKAVKAQKEEQILEEYLTSEKKEPLMMTDSIAVRNFVRQNFPEMEERICFYSSAQKLYGEMAVKKILADGASRKNIFVLNATSKVESAAEALEDENINCVVNARELYRIFLRTGVNLKKRPSEYSETLMDKLPKVKFVFEDSEWSLAKEIKVKEIRWKKEKLLCAEAVNLGQVRILLEQIRNGDCTYDILRFHA